MIFRLSCIDGIQNELSFWSDDTIITTNGIYDLIHRGHIELLRQCRDIGGRVIVGVNSDSSVKMLNNGSLRPIQDEESRAMIIHAIEYVDMVVIFDEPNPVEFVRVIQPDFHIKAGYDIETLPETPVVRGYGGKVLPGAIVEGYSTTDIIHRIAYHYCPTLDGCAVRHGPTEMALERSGR